MKNPKVGEKCVCYGPRGREVVVIKGLDDIGGVFMVEVLGGGIYFAHEKALRRLKPKAKETVWVNEYASGFQAFRNRGVANTQAFTNRTALLECRVVKRWPVKGEGK